MKPYGRPKPIAQNPKWKKDYHLHRKGRKVKNWWEEEMSDFDFRSEIKRRWMKEIDKELNEEK